MVADKIKNFYSFDESKMIGHGAFSEVVRGTHLKTGKEFAIKIMRKTKLKEEDIHSILNEIEVLNRIDHPNVVKLCEIFEDDQNFYMVMELMEGGNLQMRIAQLRDHHKKLSEKEIAQIIYPIVDAMEYCHFNNVVHRDLKPENILYESKAVEKSILKVSDFGFAKFFENQQMLTTLCGSPYYVAPEIISADHPQYDFKVDCWSLGVMLFEFLSGEFPFTKSIKANLQDFNINELFDEIKSGKYEFNENWAEISPEAKDLVSKLLIVDPKKRYSMTQAKDHPWLQKYTD
jgi:serine/threonine protein kinase